MLRGFSVQDSHPVGSTYCPGTVAKSWNLRSGTRKVCTR